MRRMLPFKKIADWLLNHLALTIILIGLFLITLALTIDLIGFGGQAGFGTKQIFIITSGFVIFLLGLYLRTPPGRQSQKAFQSFLRIKELDAVPTARNELFGRILITAVWFGLAVGFGESMFRIIAKIFQNKVLYMSQHFVWMLPLVETMIFATLGLIIFFISLVMPKIARFRWLVFIFSILALVTFYYVQPRLNIYTALILFIGISIQLSHFLGARSRTFINFERRSIPWMFTALFMIMAGMIGLYG
jgi:hypothetical protein